MIRHIPYTYSRCPSHWAHCQCQTSSTIRLTPWLSEIDGLHPERGPLDRFKNVLTGAQILQLLTRKKNQLNTKNGFRLVILVVYIPSEFLCIPGQLL